jgi:hypothetical protein
MVERKKEATTAK